MSGPSIGVVIPVLNGESYLDAAIQSVLAQTVAPLEVIVVDNGSRDDSATIAESYGEPVRCLRRPATVGPPRNDGVAATASELIAFHDADDIWIADKLERQLDALQGMPVPGLVFGEVEEFVSPELDETVTGAPRPAASVPMIQALLLRRDVFRQIGPFREDLAMPEIEWLARARRLGIREHYVPAVVVRRRRHLSNRSARSGQRQDYAHALLEVLAARRADP